MQASKSPGLPGVCLTGMSQNAEEEADSMYLDYTKKWIRAVDRGGLFHISDEVYVFFHEVERIVRRFTHKLVKQCSQHDKQDFIAEVVSDGDVQFHWSMISAELDNDVGEQLLKEIVQLWLTICGFSTAGAYVEQYKQVTQKSTMKSTGLRKGLKRKMLDMGDK